MRSPHNHLARSCAIAETAGFASILLVMFVSSIAYLHMDVRSAPDLLRSGLPQQLSERTSLTA